MWCSSIYYKQLMDRLSHLHICHKNIEEIDLAFNLSLQPGSFLFLLFYVYSPMQSAKYILSLLRQHSLHAYYEPGTQTSKLDHIWSQMDSSLTPYSYCLLSTSHWINGFMTMNTVNTHNNLWVWMLAWL